MKISQIALRNFRSGKNLVLDTSAPRVYVCGRNGVGKSSIRDAIRWTLRGVCTPTDAKGLGWEALIPAGTNALSAGVVLDGIGGVERTYQNGRRTLQLEGRDNDITSTQNAIYQLLETTPEYLDAVLETDYFLRLQHVEAKAMVLGLLNVRIPVGEESLTLAQVDTRYKEAFQARTAAKARLKAHSVPRFDVPAEGAFPSPADIQTRLEALRTELQGELGKAGQASGKREALEAQLAGVRSRIVLDVGEPPDPVGITETQALIARLEQEAAAFAKAQTPPSVVPVMERDIEERIRMLTDHKPNRGCVLDNGVSCDTAKIKFTNHVKFLRSQAQPSLPAPVAEPSPSFDRQALATAQQRLHSLLGRQMAHAFSLKSNTERSDEIDAMTAQLKSLEDGPAGVDNAATIETLKARIAKGEKVLESARDYWRQHEAHAKAVLVKAELEGHVNRLESLCEELGPNGARVKALSEAISAFEARINATTSAFGWTVTFALDPWTVHVNGRMVEAYSESEQFRIGIAIQIAVAVSSGLGFLVVDRLDMLDAKNRGLVTGMLLQPNPAISQVFILATREPEQPLPVMANVKAYRLGSTDAPGPQGTPVATTAILEASA